MKKRLIIIGDSFSLGIGANFPEVVYNENKTNLRDSWLKEWKEATCNYLKNGTKSNGTLVQILYAEYMAWEKAVITSYKGYETYDQARRVWARDNIHKHHSSWSNVLKNALKDIEVINLSSGGFSMKSVVSALSVFINMNNNHNEYETLVFFQAPDPARTNLINTLPIRKNYDDVAEFNKKIEHLVDYNYATTNNVKPLQSSESVYNLETHNKMFIEHDLFIGEWYQSIFNAQQICKANSFDFVWCTTVEEQQTLLKAPNVLNLDISTDRMPHHIDPSFNSLFSKHIDICKENNIDLGNIFAGCRHFSGVAQKHFADYMTKSLISNEEFWWQK